jgi:hypothetical protein
MCVVPMYPQYACSTCICTVPASVVEFSFLSFVGELVRVVVEGERGEERKGGGGWERSERGDGAAEFTFLSFVGPPDLWSGRCKTMVLGVTVCAESGSVACSSAEMQSVWVQHRYYLHTLTPSPHIPDLPQPTLALYRPPLSLAPLTLLPPSSIGTTATQRRRWRRAKRGPLTDAGRA